MSRPHPTGELTAFVREVVLPGGPDAVPRLEACRRRIRPRICLYWISPRRAIDGAIGGSGAEFVNHSCEPTFSAAFARGG